MAYDLDLLEGEWTVKVQGWTWVYAFDRSGRVTWRDPGSADKGSGSWTATGKSVNISWKDSATRESWLRPLTPSNDRTWYQSSYFRGKYKIEKAGASMTASEAPYLLAKPPEVYQTALYCWAAGAASWRRVRSRGNETVDQLIAQFGGYLNGDGSLPEGEPDSPDAQRGGLKAVFGKLGIYVENIAVSDFTYAYVLDKLKTKGHILLMAGSGSDMGHTYVVYGVGDPSKEYFSVFDPLFKGAGYRTKKFSDIGGSRAYVGWSQ